MMDAEPQTPCWYVIMLVLNKIEMLDAVLEAWREAGIPGATIMESSGLYARQQRKHIAMRFPFERSGAGGEEVGHYTLFTVVCGDEWIARCEQATERVTGSLDDPHTGILVAWPLSYGKGIRTPAHW